MRYLLNYSSFVAGDFTDQQLQGVTKIIAGQTSSRRHGELSSLAPAEMSLEFVALPDGGEPVRKLHLCFALAKKLGLGDHCHSLLASKNTHECPLVWFLLSLQAKGAIKSAIDVYDGKEPLNINKGIFHGFDSFIEQIDVESFTTIHAGHLALTKYRRNLQSETTLRTNLPVNLLQPGISQAMVDYCVQTAAKEPPLSSVHGCVQEDCPVLLQLAPLPGPREFLKTYGRSPKLFNQCACPVIGCSHVSRYQDDLLAHVNSEHQNTKKMNKWMVKCPSCDAEMTLVTFRANHIKPNGRYPCMGDVRLNPMIFKNATQRHDHYGPPPPGLFVVRCTKEGCTYWNNHKQHFANHTCGTGSNTECNKRKHAGVVNASAASVSPNGAGEENTAITTTENNQQAAKKLRRSANKASAKKRSNLLGDNDESDDDEISYSNSNESPHVKTTANKVTATKLQAKKKPLRGKPVDLSSDESSNDEEFHVKTAAKKVTVTKLQEKKKPVHGMLIDSSSDESSDEEPALS